MNKNGLIESIIQSTQLDKNSAGKAVNGMLAAIGEALSKGEPVTLVGFGTFSVVNRAARTGINPQTKQKIAIPSQKAVKFKAGKKLADELN